MEPGDGCVIGVERLEEEMTELKFRPEGIRRQPTWVICQRRRKLGGRVAHRGISEPEALHHHRLEQLDVVHHRRLRGNCDA